MNVCTLFGLLLVCNIVVCVHDYYAGVFNKNDLLVAQDTLYRDMAAFRTTTATYVRYFKCPISYYRIQDRLGVAQGPRIERLNGGLGQHFLLLRLTSVYGLPISVNIYIACANKQLGNNAPIYTRAHWTRAPKTTTAAAGSSGSVGTSTAGPGSTEAGETSDHEQSTPNEVDTSTDESGATGEASTEADEVTTTTGGPGNSLHGGGRK